ncbi:MAG TPA: aminomethyl-transferring glycine dehydrogenase [Gemmatimonadaceae bacterium]|nr:aminomethyl-transferring glycine dehydrogenase [Gemmatimonadaceae bacterium]
MTATAKGATRATPAASALPPDAFAFRHVGPDDAAIAEMLAALGYDSLDALIDAAVPSTIRMRGALALPPGLSEADALAAVRALARRNKPSRAFIGMGYSGTITPPVIQRNVLENPGWYTAYTPYQAEIAQGRLEALLTYQTMVMDLTGLEIANASLLDEATAAAEAMSMSYGVAGREGRETFLVAADCHPQTIDVVRTRADARGITVRVQEPEALEITDDVFGVLVQYPSTDGVLRDYRALCERAHAAGALVTAAADLLALTLVTPPGAWGADIAVGNTQRFGVPLGYGGPHAAYFATRDAYRRQLPGRIIGVSRDADGRPALRMALQTREQHIRREKATSNICTAQVLLAVMAAMYAVWHGPDGLRRIATRVRRLTRALADALAELGYDVGDAESFDTLHVRAGTRSVNGVAQQAHDRGMDLRVFPDGTLGIALDETTTAADLSALLAVFGVTRTAEEIEAAAARVDTEYAPPFARTSTYLTHPVFHRYHSETEMLRYLKRLESRDLSLAHSMIPLGSCTMKLNATAEMVPITWAEFGGIHPFAPADRAEGYRALFERLEGALREITGFAAVSLQPNAGSQGEYAGLLVIRRYQEARGEGSRDVCLIPQSAHGTNPASAVMAGLRVVVVRTDADGNIDIDDLRARAAEHRDRLAALMVTYPSTHGVFEAGIRDICRIVHDAGGQVYMDGANMNAMVGLVRPAEIGADVCHLNLHKTFCIPHGGGGPGMGPIGVAQHLVPFLPGHTVVPVGGGASGAVSAAPWGSASILPISLMYIDLMGGDGLTLATKVAILNANYVAHRLSEQYPVLYRGQSGLVAHECIVDPRAFKSSAGVEVEDIAKRLMDYGFHAPTVSFPVAGTLMIEPTESESKEELDRFCDALIAIREEIREVELGIANREDNLLKGAPHPALRIAADEWTHAYSRERAAFPAPWTREFKFWPAVGRVESAYGDRNLVCVCPPVEEYAEPASR